MSFDGAQFLRNAIRFDRVDTMMPHVMESADVATPGEVGRLGGAPVVVQTDATAELMDSMEELAMQFEEKAAKKLSTRHLGAMRARSSVYIAVVENWMRALPDLPGREALDRLLRQLRNLAASGNLPDVSMLKQMLSKLSEDPSHAFAVIDILEQALESEEQGLKSLFMATRENLLKEKGGEIRAGINLAAEVNARATTPEEMSSLRNLYRSEILGFKTPQDCFRSILSSRGAGGLTETIDFLMKGCGTDLGSTTPSRDPVELRRILLDLQCVQVLKTVLDSMNGLSARMAREFGETLLLSGEAMTGRVVDFTERPALSGDQLAAFIAACGVMRLLARMDFAREMLTVFRRLSSRLFASEEDRQRLLEATQMHLDALIAEEIDPDEEKEGQQ